MRWASHASATVWKTPIGQPMQSILLRIITLMVAGHRRIISSTVISGSMISGLFTVRVSKEGDLSHTARPELCAGANNGRNGSASYSPCDNSSLAARRRGTLKVVFKMPLWCRDDAHTLPVAVERAKLLLLWAVAFV